MKEDAQAGFVTHFKWHLKLLHKCIHLCNFLKPSLDFRFLFRDKRNNAILIHATFYPSSSIKKTFVSYCVVIIMLGWCTTLIIIGTFSASCCSGWWLGCSRISSWGRWWLGFRRPARCWRIFIRILSFLQENGRFSKTFPFLMFLQVVLRYHFRLSQ